MSVADLGKEIRVRVEAGLVCASINSDATILGVTHTVIIGLFVSNWSAMY